MLKYELAVGKNFARFYPVDDRGGIRCLEHSSAKNSKSVFEESVKISIHAGFDNFY